MSGLPGGWLEVEGLDLFELVRGVSYDKSAITTVVADGFVPILRANNISTGMLNRDELVFAPDRFVSDKQLFCPGDMVIASSSGSKAVVGKAAMVPDGFGRASFGAFCSVARPRHPDMRHWLRHYFATRAYRDFVERVALGININNLRGSDLAVMPVPVPPLAEQRRIVAKLDALTARTARARTDLDRIPALAARYKQAVLDAAYGGHLSDQPLGQLAVADVISSLDQGWSPKCDSEAAGEGQWGVIKTTAIQGVWFDDSANKRLPAHLEARSAIKIVAGDVLITRAGPRSRVGVTCVVRQTRDRLMLCDKAYRLRVNLGVMDPVFLALMLNSPQALRAIEEMKTGISDSGLNLTQGKLLALSLPVPSVEEQKRLVAKIDRAFAEIDRLTAEAAAARRQLDRLDQAVLAKAFRGELVPQDPADEPASVLLDRVRAKLAAAPKAKRAKRTAMARLTEGK